jgi:hypothetical protein
VVDVDRVGLGHDPRQPRGTRLDRDDAQVGETVERAARRHRQDHHRAVELRPHEVVDDRAAGTTHDARLVAGARVERERERELLCHGPEPVVLGVVVRTADDARGQHQRAEARLREALRLRDAVVDVDERHRAHREQRGDATEHIGSPAVVRAAQLQL